MRAVNLIPSDERSGGGGSSRTGRAPYAVLGALLVLVALVGVSTLAGRDVSTKRAQLAQLQREAAAVKSRLGSLSQFGQYASLRKARVDTVSALASSRFDWARSLDAITRTMPADAWLSSMTGTVAPGVTVEGGVQGALRSALPQPAIELVGCTTSQARLAQLMARLQAVPGVSRVTLSDSTKAAPGDASASGGGSSSCRGSHANYPKFSMVLFFGDGSAAAPAPAGTVPTSAGPATATPAPAATTPAPTDTGQAK